MIIAIDGLDGSGKETLCNSCIEILNEEYGWDSNDIMVHSFPNYSIPSGKVIYDILHGISKWDEQQNATPEMKKYILCMLYAYNRAEYFKILYNTKGINIHTENTIHIFDRYWASNILYQGVGCECPADLAQLINLCKGLENGFNNPTPDFYYFLHIPYSILRERLNNRKDMDRNEEDGFQKAVYHFTEYMIKEFDTDMLRSERVYGFSYDGYIEGVTRLPIKGLAKYEIHTPEAIAKKLLNEIDSKLNIQGLSLKNPNSIE